MRLAPLAAAVCLALALPALPGCASNRGMQPGETDYDWGTLVAVVDGSLKGTLSTAEGVLREMEFRIRERQTDAEQAKLIALQNNNPDIRIWMTAINDHRTEVRIRVGSLGDRAKSQKILDRIVASR